MNCLRLTLMVMTGCSLAVAESRIAVREGGLVDAGDGRRFVPVGVNYFRTGQVDGKTVHATFCPGFYDRDFVEKMMADVAGRGLNTVRTFQVYHVGPGGILASRDARELSAEYVANVMHFLEQARKHGLRVLFTWDAWQPESEWWRTAALAGEDASPLPAKAPVAMGVNGFRFTVAGARLRANAIVALIASIRRHDPKLLATVLAWELENEVYFHADKPPLDRREGRFGLGGRSYDLSSDGDVQARMDAAAVAWADLCTRAIKQADRDALVGVSVFTFKAVGREGPGMLSKDKTRDVRVPARPAALAKSAVDYLDVHLYAWKNATTSVGQHLRQDLASIEHESLRKTCGKPILVGECGVFASYLRGPDKSIDHAAGAACLAELLSGVRDGGFAGALYWHYGSPDSRPDDANPAMRLFPEYGRSLLDKFASAGIIRRHGTTTTRIDR